MENVIKIPVDLPQLPPFRQLVAALGSAPAAMWVWFSVWQELLYKMQEGGSPGRLNRVEATAMIREILASGSRTTVFGGEQDPVMQALFKADGDDMVCIRFAALHAGVSSAPRSMAQRGGDMRAFKMRQKQAEAGAFQQSLQIAEWKFVDAEGKPLEADMVKRVTRLIIACDNALFKPQRPPFAWTEGLIQVALVVACKYSDEEIDHVVRLVASHRDHPRLTGFNADKLLMEFGAVAGDLSK